MKYLNRYYCLIIFFTLLACKQNGTISSDSMSQEIISVAPQADQVAAVERKLIKEGTVEFESDDLQTTKKTIIQSVNKYKGYISSDREYKSPDRKTNIIVIRVPSDNFDNLLQDATLGVSNFDVKDINVLDVTEEFLDINARLKTKKELEARYLSLIKQTKNITEVIAIEKQIGELRADIESVEGRLKYLQNNVSFSTLTITSYQNVPDQNEFTQKFKNGFGNGWDNLIWFFVGLTNIWPFIIIIILLIFGFRYYKKRRSKKLD